MFSSLVQNDDGGMYSQGSHSCKGFAREWYLVRNNVQRWHELNTNQT